MDRGRVIRAVVTVVCLVAVLTFLIWGGRPRPARIIGAGFSDRSNISPYSIEVVVASCNADLSFRVRESEEAVAIIVWNRFSTQDDCADGLRIPLDSPLGDRRVFDLSDWSVVELN